MRYGRLMGSFALAVTTALASQPVLAQSFPTDDQIRGILEERIAEGRAVGLVVGVLEADGSSRIVLAGSAGPDARPLAPETLFEIGSVTKVFTGSLLAEMARRGEVALTDPVEGYLPDGVGVPSRGGKEIALVDLATHRSALPRLPTNMDPSDPGNPYADYTVEQLYAFLSSYELPREIGATAEYSNLGVGLLGHALGRAAGSSYEDALRERILEPLGLVNTTITLSEEQRALMAQGHGASGEVVSHWDIPTLAGAGALHSDVTDMLRWLSANVGEAETDLEEALRSAQEPRLPLAESPGEGIPSVGLNWVVQPAGDASIVWHNGGTGGFSSFVGFDPVREVGVVVLANSQQSIDDIAWHLLDPSRPLTPAPLQRTEVQVDPEILSGYAGEYQLAPEFSIVVTHEDGALFAQATGQGRFPIFAESENTFFYRVVDAQITFERDASGNTTGLILHQGGQNMPASKVR